LTPINTNNLIFKYETSKSKGDRVVKFNYAYYDDVIEPTKGISKWVNLNDYSLSLSGLSALIIAIIVIACIIVVAAVVIVVLCCCGILRCCTSSSDEKSAAEEPINP